ncbi:MAG: gliding motility protein GldL [Bacteroidales bacterium]|jgi:gliding motility-associated protein GldL|nr:gliding motility protein GldL [Bacteroidales bacterium]
MGLSEIVHTSRWKAFMAKLYGWGASVVIIGALFKIQHFPYAGLLLSVGLITEAVIFFFSAFEPLKEEPDWKLVYPQLDPNYSGEEIGFAAVGGGGGGGYGGGAGLSQFDKMLADAGITPDVFDKLSSGLKKLTETTNNFNAMGDLAATTNEYATTIKKANESLQGLSESVRQTARSMNDTSTVYQAIGESSKTIETGGRSYHEKLEALNKNLSALNAAYELQLRGANDHVKSSEVVYKGIEGLMKDLSGSADDTKKYREQVAKLNENLGSLNNVYGNMLAAMNVK